MNNLIKNKIQNCIKYEKARYNYPTFEFIEDLRKELFKILPKKELLYGKRLSDSTLSLYLDQNNNHLYQIKKNSKRNPNFQLSLKLIREYKQALISKFGDQCKKALFFVDKYDKLNNLKRENKKFMISIQTLI